MNHDYAHCSDYNIDCPKECYRGQLALLIIGAGVVITLLL